MNQEQIVLWVRAAQVGDDLSFTRLIRSYQDLAVAYAASLLGDYHLAEDAAQEAFVDAYRALPTLREPAAFGSWFRTVLFKHCDRFKRRKRIAVTDLEDAMDVVSPDPLPHDRLEAEETRQSLCAAVASLSEAERSVVLLYYMGEHSQSAIAEFLNITPNTVKTRLYSARKRLRTHMGQIKDNLNAARPSNGPDFARRVITAALPLQLYHMDERGNSRKVGSTLGSRAVEPPESGTWWIEPGGTLSGSEWDTIIALMEEYRIPGLSVEKQMTDAALERLSHLDHLTYLGMPGSAGVTNAGLQTLSRLPQLQHLDLTAMSVSDDGLAVLNHLPQLRSFKMVHNARVTDAGLARLANCPNLERVELMGTETGDGVIQALVGKGKLQHFKSGDRVTNAGLALLREWPVFQIPPDEKTTLNLMGFDVHPNFLLLRGTFTDAGMAHLADLNGLYALNLDNSDLAVTAEGLKHLIDLPHLGWLAFDAKDDSMPHIAAMPRLRFLMCQDTVAGDEGFVALSRSQSIENIWGRRCYNLGGRGFAAMANMPALRGLSVSCKNVDDAGLSALPRFPALTHLMPMDVPDDGFRHVGQCKNLEKLTCMYCNDTTDAATEHLAGLTTLKTYEAWSTQITDRSLEILSKLTSLERVLVYNCPGVTDAGVTSIAKLPRLQEVTLETLPNVSPEAALAFPAHVRVNQIT